MLFDHQHLAAHVSAQRTELETALRHAAAVAEARPRRPDTIGHRLTAIGRDLASLHGHLRWRHHHPVRTRHPVGT